MNGCDEHWLSVRARMTPEAPALIDDDGAISWSRLAARAQALAGGLRARGIKTGDRVAVRCAPGMDFVALLHAVQAVGAISVPLAPTVPPGEIARLLSIVRAALVVVDGADTELKGAVPVATLAEPTEQPHGDFEIPRIDPEAAHSILFTSGTAGRPKGVVLSNRNHHASALAACERLKLRADDVWLAAMPLNHVGGLSILLRSAIVGFAVALRPRFDAADFDRAVRRHGASIASMVPTMLLRWLDHLDHLSGAIPESFRCALIGGAGLGPALLERARRAGIPVATTYGLTETCSQVTTGAIGEASVTDAGVVDSGPALDGTRIEIENPDGAGVGDIVVIGPSVMHGYFEDEAATAAVLQRGRLRTGDRGSLTADGKLQVLGRSDEVIITGGENVSPAEVEEVLAAHPQVVDAGVYAVYDERWGQAVMAKVVLAEPSELDAAALREWCRPRLAGFKIPKRIGFVASLPRTGSGKLRRTDLADLAELPAKVVG